MGDIRYLNTDLELTSASDLTALATALTTRGLFALLVDQRDDGLWHASFETSETYDTPAESIASILVAIEGLNPAAMTLWAGCMSRTFNVGYDCGTGPRVVEHELSSDLVRRVASTNASLAITLYGSGKP